MKNFLSILFLFAFHLLFAQALDFTAIRTEVDFNEVLREWDGFGFNYVETAQTTDYRSDPQEYGGFSLLNEQQKREITNMVFGENGLKVGLVKMFYDPWHQMEAGGAFDHETTTQYMRDFVRRGLEITKRRGGDLKIITTLYGPPPFITRQNFLRGRDFNPEMKASLARYYSDWVRFLIKEENFPVEYVSLHNEGEDWWRWPADGSHGNIGEGHDYNMYWPPELVTSFIPYLRNKFDEAGLKKVGITNGEPTNWYRFSTWGYAGYLYQNEQALNDLGLITSHGFYSGDYGGSRWFGTHMSMGIDLLRSKRPQLHAWVTSTSWSKMDAQFVAEIHGNIYSSKVNGIIPWAGIQRPPLWVGGDPNPGSAFTVNEDGSYEVRLGYYNYKQVSRAGQPGMGVALTMSMDSQLPVIAFASNGTRNPDAFVVINRDDEDKKVSVKIKGSKYDFFEAFRTTDDMVFTYDDIGTYKVNGQVIIFEAPKHSVTTFFGRKEQ